MILYDAPFVFVATLLFALGAALGSFLNVCIYRIPKHDRLLDQLRGLNYPPSTCPRCGTRILIRDNLPIIGWLLLLGRCRNCAGKISPRYPLIELFNGLLFVFVFWMEVPIGFRASLADSCLFVDIGPQIVDVLSDRAFLNGRFLYHLVLIEGLVVATFIDFDLRIIPDGSTLPAMFVAVLAGGVVGQLWIVPVWFQSPAAINVFKQSVPGWLIWGADRYPDWILHQPQLHGLAVSLVGLVIGGGIVWMVRIVGHWILKQEAMGFGDVVLMAMIGSFIGWQPVVVVFFIAPMCALTVVALSWVFRRDREIPYGPYLSLATLVVVLGWKWIWPVVDPIFSSGPMLLALAVLMVVMLIVSLYCLQLVKRLLGIPLHPPDHQWVEEWTSADQLLHFAGETVDPDRELRQQPVWNGTASGRGMEHHAVWRRSGPGGFDWQWKNRPRG